MSRAFEIIKNMHTKLGYHIRRDAWKPSVCHLNAYTMIPKKVDPPTTFKCDCIVTCKVHPNKPTPELTWYGNYGGGY